MMDAGAFKKMLDKHTKGVYFRDMTARLSLACVIAWLLAAGCAGMGAEEHERLLRQNAEIRASAEDSRARVDELTNKLMLLHEKLEATRSEVERLDKAMAERALNPPEGLKVVSLDEEATREATEPQPAKEAKKKEEKAKAEARAPEELYNKAQDFFISGDYAVARKVFAELAGLHPQSPLADNAIYWIGESYYSEKDFSKAIDKFKEVVDAYPNENKAPDALLKIALSYKELEDRVKAIEYLERLIKRYPDSEAAQKARKLIEGLRRE
jgi:tol-pal system protein YbgF